MTVTEAIQAVLEAGTTITALVPTSRIRAPGAWEGLDRPWIRHQPITPDVLQGYDARVPLLIWRYQVDVFSDSYSTGEAVANAVITDCEGVHGLDSPITDYVDIRWLPGTFYMGREDETGIEHFALEFMVSKELT